MHQLWERARGGSFILMTQILSAAHKPYSTQQFLAAEMKQIMNSIPGDTKTKYKYARRILRALLNTKVNVNDPVEKVLLDSATKLAQTYNRPDTYPNQSDAPNVNDNAKDKPSPQSQYPDRQSCVQANVNAGFSLAAANANCNRYFPPGPATQGGVEQKQVNNAKGKSNVTTYYPTRSGFKQSPQILETYRKVTNTKQASNETPYWAEALFPDTNLPQGAGNIRNAAVEKQNQEVTDLLSGIESKASERFKGASVTKEEIQDSRPGWAQALNIV